MQVFARTYRPRKLSDLVGQPIVNTTLSNAFAMNKLHHALLFVGQYGGGKTSTARILAAMENCLVSPGLEPCGKCQVCSEVFEGKHNDIVEIDAASNAGSVEQIRELKKEAMYNPTDGARINYFIIDEVHRASPAASDALLKLLEEPPSKTRFILCTTDVQKLRPAIISRCQQHTFNKIFWMEISDYLKGVAGKENISIEQGAINLCARMSKGSMRTALQYLEKLASFSGGKGITIDDAEKLFGAVDETLFYDLLDEAIGVGGGKPDTAKAFSIINGMFRNGSSYEMIASGVSDHLQYLMIGLTSSKSGELITVSNEVKERLKEQLRYCQETKKLPAVLKSIDSLASSNFAVGYGLQGEMLIQKWFLESLYHFRSS